MQINATTDYAIRTVIYLSTHRSISTAGEISRAINISSNYILKIMKKLVEANIVKTTKGVKGGFEINKKPSDISLYDIISIMENTININQCLDDEANCSMCATKTCPVRAFYLSFQEEMESKFKEQTIQMLIDNMAH
ncbi:MULTISPECIES: RrF2 family transcriptional regulator [Helcococcus]|uniref:Rrf2 family transcriptional regulator n=1 Tax=Helcococcus bovis TaxID=3153252 RepID=A0ABW9F8C3_9FIRM